ARRDVAQVDADARHDAFFQRIFVDPLAARVEMPGRVDMGAAMVGHGKIHRRETVHIAAVRKRLFMRLPHAVNDRGMAGIIRRAVIELAAEVDNLHKQSFPERCMSSLRSQGPIRRGVVILVRWPPAFLLQTKSGGYGSLRSQGRHYPVVSLTSPSYHTGLMPALAMTSRHFGTSVS